MRDLLVCEQDTGKLYWKSRPREEFTSDKAWAVRNGRYAGRMALTASTAKGYKIGRVDGEHIYAHRAIWALCHGEWPSGEIDHINGNPADNRLENLRVVSTVINARNKRMPDNNTSGRVGVYWNREISKWVASITLNKKTKALGCFADFDEACAVREAEERKHGFHENHGRKAA